MPRCASVAVLVLLLAPACGDDDGPAEVEGLPTVDGVPEVVVVATDFAFAPDVLHLVAGEPVNVVLESAEGGHNLGVVEPGGFLLPIVDEGEVTRGALTIGEPGTYDLACTVPGHAQEGMVGTVEVSEPA
jgi:plastocyanin